MKKPGFIRDLIFGGMGTVILYNEVFRSETAEPLLIFAAFFLMGLVPAARADDASGSGNIKDWLKEWLFKESSGNDDQDGSPPRKK